jgi:two-component system, OmpR family, response regulator VicR
LNSSSSIEKVILCVEEVPESCEFLTYLLPEYEIIYVSEIENALDKFNSTLVTLCLLDFRSIENKGLELCQKLHQHNPSAAIIFTSGAWQNEEIQKVLNSGATYYLVKPYLTDELLSLIKKAFSE